MRLAHSLRLARIDVTRMVRKRTDPDSRAASVVSVGLYALLTVAVTLGGAWGGRALGRTLASGSLDALPADAVVAARGLVGVLWVVTVAVVGIRAVGQRGTLTNAEGVLTVVPTAEAYLGLLLSEYVYLLLWTLLPGIGLGVGLALGADVLWPAAGVPLVVALGAASAVAVAYAAGLAIRHALGRFPFVARHKTGLIALVFVAYMAAIVSGSLNQVVIALFDPLSASPLGWYADLAVVGLPALSFEAVYGVGAVVATAALVAAGALAGLAIADRHWFADPALAGEEPDETDEAAGAAEGTAAAPGAQAGVLTRQLEARFGRPTTALVVLAWRRAARSPLKLMYAAYPLFFATGVFVDVLQTGEIPAYLPYGLLVFVAWAAGVVFTLNPLGDQGSVLPTTLLSEVTGRRFVLAHVLAGLLVAVPVGTAMVAVAAALSPLETERVALLVALAPVAMVVAAALSMGIGTAFPRFEATNVTRSMEAVVPSPWAFALFSVHVVLSTVSALFLGLPGARSLGAALLTAALPFGLSVSTEGLYYASGAALAVLLVLPPLAYRYAVRTFDEYTIA